MDTIVCSGIEVPVDDDGFIHKPECWNPEMASVLAATEGVEALTPEHWKVIDYIRAYFEENDVAPRVRTMCKETGLNLRQIFDLFPSGPAKGACKVAGLPEQTGCV